MATEERMEQATITISLSVQARNNGDEWAFYVPDLGFTIYADSHKEGNEAVQQAIQSMFNVLQDDPDRLIAYLEARRIMYKLTPDIFDYRPGVVNRLVGESSSHIMRFEGVLSAPPA